MASCICLVHFKTKILIISQWKLTIFSQLLFGTVGIVNHLPIPIPFKRRYSYDEETAGADYAEMNEEIVMLQSHQIMEKVFYFLV